MWSTVRAGLIGLMCVSLTSCGWIGCRKKRKDYGKPLPPGVMALRKLTDPEDYPDFGAGFRNRQGMAEAIDNSLGYYAKPSSKEHFPYLDIEHERAVQTLEVFKQVIAEAKDPADLNRIIAERFDVYISIGCDDMGTVLYTGYCTPIFKGSLERSPEYRHPLYKRPADLEIKTDGTPMGRKTGSGIVPYYTRSDIETKQLLAGKKLELVYLKDELEVFIAHVQGSAIIELPDGTQRCAGYHGKTDRPYTSLGLSLVADGKIERGALSLQKIMEYFKLHPHEQKHYMYKNESYVFFHWAESGPRGSLNTPVVPYRSIATDKAVFPRGLLTFLVTELPQMETRDNVVFEPYYGFALDQDTGGAIRSAGRCDVYMGVGPDALLLAGRTNAEGKLYYLAVK
ncbi:MltA domain-containing protein [bacterium]|nr:MltA domain-containing protein [bacterium]